MYRISDNTPYVIFFEEKHFTHYYLIRNIKEFKQCLFNQFKHWFENTPWIFEKWTIADDLREKISVYTKWLSEDDILDSMRKEFENKLDALECDLKSSIRHNKICDAAKKAYETNNIDLAYDIMNDINGGYNTWKVERLETVEVSND